MKIQMSLNDDLVKRVDKFAKENYLSRSAVVSISLNQYLNANEMTTAIREMALSMRKIADTGEIDEETKKQLEDFERLSLILTTSQQ